MNLKTSTAKKFRLTPRETQVAGLVMNGEDRKTIASELKISVYTVNDFLRLLRFKTFTRSTYQLAFALLNENSRKKPNRPKRRQL